ncbi:MAG: phosphatase PAP2 family protein [Actinomycetota bacterium]|nr:phosphatase PAP2 family protein [Acidimicrobiia bacterium]MDQ3469586.1 phosphatase PAP2 family protein [Actinomycetota bacterium]
MTVTLVVLVTALATAGAVFAVSTARGPGTDPVDAGHAEEAAVRELDRHPRLAHFLRQRMDRRTAGGFVLTIGLVVVFAAALVIGVLFDMVGARTGLAEFDDSIAEWGSRNASSGTVEGLQWVTDLGSTPVVIAALVVAGVADYWRRRNAEVFAFLAAVGLGQLIINNALKLIVSRERPDVLQLAGTDGWSFPSGHATAAAAGWAAIALVLGRGRSNRTRTVLGALAVLIAVAVATTRALLGVHWLTDVVAGVALGWAWFLLVAVVFGGRAQRLGDPVSAHPQGLYDDPERPADATAARQRAG